MPRFQRHGNPKPFMIFNEDRRQVFNPMTVCIAGLPRGGTTMVAAIVHALGVDLGPEEDLKGFTFEDQTMNRPYVNEQLEYIEKRNSEHSIWGWKDPGALHPFTHLSYALRNPRAIIVFRNSFDIIESEMRFDKTHGHNRPFEDLVPATMDRIQRNWDFILRAKAPMMVLSYERTISDPTVVVHEINRFLGNKGTPDRVQEAINRVSQSGGYMQW